MSGNNFSIKVSARTPLLYAVRRHDLILNNDVAEGTLSRYILQKIGNCMEKENKKVAENYLE